MFYRKMVQSHQVEQIWVFPGYEPITLSACEAEAMSDELPGRQQSSRE